MARQYRTMRLVAAHTDLPVPRTLWLEEDPAYLGAPFFVMARAAGRVPPDVMPYTYEGNWLYDATDAQRDHLEAASVSVLARLHDQVPSGAAGFLATSGTGDALRRHVEAQRAYYRWVVDGRPRSPLIERGFARLADLWPADPGETVLTWGDARIGNIVYDGFEPTAVLDWEMAALGPRELDLGWMVFLHRFFQDLAESGGRRGCPDSCAVTASRTAMPGSPDTGPAPWSSTPSTRPCGTPSSCCEWPTARSTSGNFRSRPTPMR